MTSKGTGTRRPAATNANDEEASLTLLAGIRGVFAEHPEAEFLSSDTLAGALRECELTPAGLARKLRPYGVSPVRNTARTARGYRLEHLADAFARHLRPEASEVSGTPADREEPEDCSEASKSADGSGASRPADGSGSSRPADDLDCQDDVVARREDIPATPAGEASTNGQLTCEFGEREPEITNGGNPETPDAVLADSPAVAESRAAVAARLAADLARVREAASRHRR